MASAVGHRKGAVGHGRSVLSEARSFLHRIVLAVLLAVALLVPAAEARELSSQSNPGDPPARRVFSVADLHGDYKHAQLILRYLGLLGPGGEWTGGNSVLVQTGDITDRGPSSGDIYRMLFRLQDEAPKHGGEVVLLIGNHELMNLQGDFRYGTREESASLATKTTTDRRTIFSPRGWVGQRLRERGQAVALLGPEHGLQRPVLFSHAGVGPQVADWSGSGGGGAKAAGALNAAIAKLLAGDEAAIRSQDSPLLKSAGPFWLRRLALGREASGVCEELRRSLEVFGASRMVVGHTAQDDGRIHDRCGGRLVLADTVISEAYYGVSHPSALEFSPNGEVTAIYPDSGERAPLPTPPAEPWEGKGRTPNRSEV